MLIELRLNQFNYSLTIDDSEINMQRTPEHRIRFIETEVALAARKLIEHCIYNPGLPFSNNIPVGSYQPYVPSPMPYNAGSLISELEEVLTSEELTRAIEREEMSEKRGDERFDEKRMERIVYNKAED